MNREQFSPIEGVQDPVAMTNFRLTAKVTRALWTAIAYALSVVQAIIPPAILGGGKVYDIRAFSGLDHALSVIATQTATLYITQDVAVTANLPIPSNISVVVLKGGSFSISSGATLTLSGYMRIYGSAAINPASGGTFAMGSDSVIDASADWRNTAGGGSFTYAAGSWEIRTLDKVSSPTGGRIVHLGFPGNTLDEASGTCLIFGGTSGFPHSLGDASELSGIHGGYDNHIGDSCAASTITGGAHHEIHDDSGHSFIGGGAYLESFAGYAALVAGTLLQNYSTFGFMGAGHENVLGNPAVTPIDQRAGVLVGGYQNSVRGLRATHVGGWANQTHGDYAFGGGGRNNAASGENAVIPGGQSNEASAKNTGITHGQSNIANSLAALAGGESATAAANYAVAIGEFLNADATASWATGMRSRAVLYGQRAHASGYFAARGDAQLSDLVARVLTEGSQTKDLDLFGGTSNPIALPNNTSWCFRIRLIARNIDTDGENGAWTFEGAISRDGTAASTALIGAVTTTTINAPAGWSAVVQADATNGALQIQVSTDVTVTDDIRWVARIELVEAAG